MFVDATNEHEFTEVAEDTTQGIELNWAATTLEKGTLNNTTYVSAVPPGTLLAARTSMEYLRKRELVIAHSRPQSLPLNYRLLLASRLLYLSSSSSPSILSLNKPMFLLILILIIAAAVAYFFLSSKVKETYTPDPSTCRSGSELSLCSISPGSFCAYEGPLKPTDETPIILLFNQIWWSMDGSYYVTFKTPDMKLVICNASHQIISYLTPAPLLAGTASVLSFRTTGLYVNDTILYSAPAVDSVKQFDLVKGQVTMTLTSGSTDSLPGLASDIDTFLPYKSSRYTDNPINVTVANILSAFASGSISTLAMNTPLFATSIASCTTDSQTIGAYFWGESLYPILTASVHPDGLSLDFSINLSNMSAYRFYKVLFGAKTYWAYNSQLTPGSIFSGNTGGFAVCTALKNDLLSMTNTSLFPYASLGLLLFANWPVLDAKYIQRLNVGTVYYCIIYVGLASIAGINIDPAALGPDVCVIKTDFTNLVFDAQLSIPFTPVGIEAMMQASGYDKEVGLALLNKYFTTRPYPYITDAGNELIDSDGITFRAGYSNIIASWLLYFDVVQLTPQEKRFNGFTKTVNLSTGDADTTVRAYMMNRPDGVDYHQRRNDINRNFCESLAVGLCQIPAIDTQNSSADIVTYLRNRRIHLESDLCRIVFQGPLNTQLTNGQQQIRNLSYFCSLLSNQFADQDVRTCCSGNNTDYCKYLNGLFTNNGNCSCFMDSAAVQKLLQVPSDANVAVSGLTSNCYTDCTNHWAANYNNEGLYAAVAQCASNICVQTTNDQIEITNANVNLNKYTLACCNQQSASTCGLDTTIPSGTSPATSSSATSKLPLIIGISVGVLVVLAIVLYFVLKR